MSGIINWLRTSRVYVVTLTLYGDPSYHMGVFKENNSGSDAIAPFQQWIFNDAEMAQRAAQGICKAIVEKGKEAGSTIEINILEDVAKSSRDIVLCVEMNDDSDDSTQYRLYVSAFEQKPSGEWI